MIAWKNVYRLDVVLEEYDAVVRCLKLWMTCYDHADHDDCRCDA